jgi:hypothetical protein
MCGLLEFRAFFGVKYSPMEQVKFDPNRLAVLHYFGIWATGSYQLFQPMRWKHKGGNQKKSRGLKAFD